MTPVRVQAVTLKNTERTRAEVTIETRSIRVLPGQFLKGEVIANTEETLEIKSAQLTLACVEETHISTRIPFISGNQGEKHSTPPGRLSGAYQRSVIMERSSALRGEHTVSPPRARFPFEVEMPREALPSYSGRSATVGWWLEAKVISVSGGEILARNEITVLPLAQRNPRSIVEGSKPDARVGLELEVFKDVVEPGGEVEGRLTVTRVRAKPQGIMVKLIAHEFAKARQTVGYQIDTRDVLLAAKELFERERLREGASQRFTLKVPDGIATYVGENSSSRMLVRATAAFRFRRDISLTAQVHVGSFV